MGGSVAIAGAVGFTFTQSTAEMTVWFHDGGDALSSRDESAFSLRAFRERYLL